MKRNGEDFVPVYDSWDISEEHRSRLETARQTGVRFAQDLLSVRKDLAELEAFGYAYLDSVLERLLRFPDTFQAKKLGQLTHRDSFGCASHPRTLAKAPGILKKSTLGFSGFLHRNHDGSMTGCQSEYSIKRKHET